jgi:V8-like Glu-specific endopeptidase
MTITGCGKSSNKSALAIEIFPDMETLIASLDQQKVVCGEAGRDCPGYAALLTFWVKAGSEYKLGRCSGTLYKNKYIITNSHCIPPEIKHVDADCTDQIKVVFPITKSLPAESVRCKRIIQAYEQDKHEPDIAVFELENTIFRQSVVLNKNAFGENINVYAYTMNPTTKVLGTITKKNCKMSLDNAINMETEKSASEGAIFGNSCDVVSGNSGSGLFNEAGQLIGAVYAKLERPVFNQRMIEAKIKYNDSTYLGFAYNLGCLSSILSNSGLGCTIREQSKTDINNFIDRAIFKQKLQGIPESEIKYALTADLKLSLTSGNTDPSTSLVSFREKWIKLYASMFSNMSNEVVESLLK